MFKYFLSNIICLLLLSLYLLILLKIEIIHWIPSINKLILVSLK